MFVVCAYNFSVEQFSIKWPVCLSSASDGGIVVARSALGLDLAEPAAAAASLGGRGGRPEAGSALVLEHVRAQADIC